MKTILVLVVTALSFAAFGQGTSVKKELANSGNELITAPGANLSLPSQIKKPVNQVQFEKIVSIQNQIAQLEKMKSEYIEMATGMKTDGYDIGFEQEKEPKAELIGFFVFKPIKQ